MDSEFNFVASGLLLARDLVIGGLEALVLRPLIKKNATLCECQLYCRISHCGYFCRNGGDDD